MAPSAPLPSHSGRQEQTGGDNSALLSSPQLAWKAEKEELLYVGALVPEATYCFAPFPEWLSSAELIVM